MPGVEYYNSNPGNSPTSVGVSLLTPGVPRTLDLVLWTKHGTGVKNLGSLYRA